MNTEIKIYHYTSINNLALILQSKSIRFTSLLSANDKLEGGTKDFGAFGKYVFVSCWTKNPEESLPLWNMYTDRMRGVRIELPLLPFSCKKIDNRDLLVEPFKAINKNGDWLFPDQKPFIYIEYTDIPEKLNPSIKIGEIGLEPVKVGKYKSKLWAFEEEVRFRIYIFPADNTITEEPLTYDYASDVLESGIPPTVNDHFIEIKDGAFESMKVRKGPKLRSGDSEIVSALMGKYNPRGAVEESDLQYFIR